MTWQRTVALVGLALIGVAVVLGLMPISRDGASCGRAWQSSSASLRADLTNSLTGAPVGAVADCRDAREGRQTLTWALLVPGLLLGLAGVAARRETAVH